ncbi:hypothetical protein SteCoe_5520 [Stentor coeruleus]|uniref:Cyclic nucleotide-binding domain-containing protein n=1 Tax=Stentor coeruleus TaxID=5963 RepID=A0A1R2CS89_9CILI|nr:hypothetical protein SteCoe_5520 [Stentor coeruleus]
MPLHKRYYKILITLINKTTKSQDDINRIADLLTKIDEFAPYISSLSTLSLEELASSMKLTEFHRLEIIFLKNSYSDKLYIIAKGHVLLYDSAENGKKFLVTTLGPGKVLGERGLIRHLPRSLTAVSKKHTYLLTLDLSTFSYIMRNQLQSNIEEKIAFLERKFPRSFGFKSYQKEKIAYCIDIKKYKRDDIIIEQGKLIEYLIMIHSGECLLTKNYDYKQIKIICLGSGCMIADECVFYNEPSHYTCRVVSENAKLYFVKKQHFLLQCSQEVANKLTKLCKARVATRDEMAEVASRVVLESSSFSNTVTKFPLAHPMLRKKFSVPYNVSQSNESLLCVPGNLNKSKEKLINLRKRVNLNRSLMVSRNSLSNSILI